MTIPYSIDADELEAKRHAIAETGRKMLDQGLTKGTGGNVSSRVGEEHAVISPSGMAYEEITDEDVPLLTLTAEQVDGDRKPSAESAMHTMVYRQRAEVGGIVHNHSPYASTFASLGEPIGPSHYLIAFAGDQVPVAPYETYGTEELGAVAAETLGEEYNACLLENHGVLAVGDDLDSAFETALMVEYCARIHYQARNVGEPNLLAADEIETLVERFAGYGQQH